jgi:hypothetical protein
VSIPTRGLTFADRQLIIGTAIGALIIYPLVAFAIVGATPATLGPRLLLGTVVIAATSLGLANIQAIRRVDVDDSGVTFRYVLRRVHASWTDLRPPHANRYAREYGGIYMRRVVPSAGGGIGRGHFVTCDQARAILSHAACPKWTLEEGLRSYLRLDG